MNEQLKNLPDENSRRFVAVLNERIEAGRLMNALGHMSAGLSGMLQGRVDLSFLQYQDASGGIHPHISHFPFIVLKAENSNQIRKVRAEALAQGIPFTDFVHTMILGSSAAQLDGTAAKKEEELEYFGICMFGETDVLKKITKRFSLYK
jgi:hypothetical protein